MNPVNKTIVTNFIEEIWNLKEFEKIDKYISTDFVDHSLPTSLPANKDGMKRWIIATGESFQHKTIIDDIVCEDESVMLKMTMHLRHIGVWRGIEPTHREISTVGYRFYKIVKRKIVAHWSLLDGNSIENQLNETFHGCKIQR